MKKYFSIEDKMERIRNRMYFGYYCYLKKNNKELPKKFSIENRYKFFDEMQVSYLRYEMKGLFSEQNGIEKNS